MIETLIILPLHGSGLENIFAHPRIHIFEISDRDFPNPKLYALAVSLNHHYWFIDGKPVRERQPGYHNVIFDFEEVKVVIEQVESAINATAECPETNS